MSWGWRADASVHISHVEDFDLALRARWIIRWMTCTHGHFEKITLGTMCIMDWKRDSKCRMSNVGVSTAVSRQPGMAVWLRTRGMDTSGVTPGAG